MVDKEYRQYMKHFFEQYYHKLSQNEINIKLPLDESEKEMWSDDANPKEEWKKWKLVPATISEKEIEDLENEIAVKLPLSLKAFLTVYYHYFEDPIGRNSFSEPFEAIENAWNPILVRYGYLPFTWDKDGYYIRCIKLEQMPDEEKCGIYQIDHELLFNFDEKTVEKQQIDKNMQFISQNLLTYLDEILNDKDKDSLMESDEKAILTTLKNECEIVNFEDFVEKSNNNFESIQKALKPIQEQYLLSDDDMEMILDILEYRL